jgi:hypothetical protein
MKWMGLAVLLVVPLAYLMICAAVFLERQGIASFFRRSFAKIRKRFEGKRSNGSTN